MLYNMLNNNSLINIKQLNPHNWCPGSSTQPSHPSESNSYQKLEDDVDPDVDSDEPASESAFYQLLGILTDVNSQIIKSVLKKVITTAAESFFKAVV